MKDPFVAATGLHGCSLGEYKVLWGSTQGRSGCWFEVHGLPVGTGWVTPPPTTGNLTDMAMNLHFL